MEDRIHGRQRGRVTTPCGSSVRGPLQNTQKTILGVRGRGSLGSRRGAARPRPRPGKRTPGATTGPTLRQSGGHLHPEITGLGRPPQIGHRGEDKGCPGGEERTHGSALGPRPHWDFRERGGGQGGEPNEAPGQHPRLPRADHLRRYEGERPRKKRSSPHSAGLRETPHGMGKTCAGGLHLDPHGQGTTQSMAPPHRQSGYPRLRLRAPVPGRRPPRLPLPTPDHTETQATAPGFHHLGRPRLPTLVHGSRGSVKGTGKGRRH